MIDSNIYVLVILVLAVLLLLSSTALLFLMRQGKSDRPDRKHRKTQEFLHYGRRTEELAGSVKTPERKTESLAPGNEETERSDERTEDFYDLQKICYIHTDTIIE